MNRRATPALSRSVPAVKADAARTLFTVNCSQIVWAVIDSGVDARHYAFADAVARSENQVRSLASQADLRFHRHQEHRDARQSRSRRRADTAAPLLNKKLKKPLDPVEADDALKLLAKGARDGRSTNWQTGGAVRRARYHRPDNRPRTNHGTHVAGILGASRKGAEWANDEVRDPSVNLAVPDWANGMCPDIAIYDFRVLAPTLKETEFAIIAALQFIRHVNDRYSFMTIHGANLSLSIPHDVRNFACGRTPVCNECERLVNSGVVVVAAAGNRGYQNFETADGVFESYAAFSVTDPGNADGVITVGSTHRFWPHTYGVSFFSSRGPTGDGRLKPDLVAPGRAHPRTAAWQHVGRSGWHEHGGATCQRRGGDADGALLGARRSAAPDQGHSLQDRHRPRA